jgi:hypothetical protein
MSRRLSRSDVVATALLFAGIVALAVALAWWGLVFGNVAANTSLSIQAAVPCLVNTSDLCSLAMSLCGAGHWFGITRYWEGLFWAGAALTAAAAAFQFVGAKAGTGSQLDGKN